MRRNRVDRSARRKTATIMVIGRGRKVPGPRRSRWASQRFAGRRGADCQSNFPWPSLFQGTDYRRLARRKPIGSCIAPRKSPHRHYAASRGHATRAQVIGLALPEAGQGVPAGWISSPVRVRCLCSTDSAQLAADPPCRRRPLPERACRVTIAALVAGAHQHGDPRQLGPPDLAGGDVVRLGGVILHAPWDADRINDRRDRQVAFLG